MTILNSFLMLLLSVYSTASFGQQSCQENFESEEESLVYDTGSAVDRGLIPAFYGRRLVAPIAIPKPLAVSVLRWDEKGHRDRPILNLLENRFTGLEVWPEPKGVDYAPRFDVLKLGFMARGENLILFSITKSGKTLMMAQTAAYALALGNTVGWINLSKATYEKLETFLNYESANRVDLVVIENLDRLWRPGVESFFKSDRLGAMIRRRTREGLSTVVMTSPFIPPASGPAGELLEFRNQNPLRKRFADQLEKDPSFQLINMQDLAN